MSNNSDKGYPYEIKELTPEENEGIRNVLAGFKTDFIRIGPKGYLLSKKYAMHAANIYNFPVRSQDVFVASYPKSGTTWTQELVWLLGNNLDYEKAKSVTLTDRFPFFEISVISDLEGGGGTELVKGLSNNQFRDVLKALLPMTIDQIKELPSPRFIKTHLPMSLLPPNLLDTAKVVYIARDPRDIVVSFYYHNRLMRILNLEVELKPQWELFIQNKIMWTPYFDHLLEAWQKRNHPNLLFLFYEELSKDLSASIRRVAEFLGKPITEEEVATLQEHLKFDNFKKNKSVNMENLQKAGVFKEGETFIRKGKVGGWRDYFDDEMTAQAEKWIADNIRDTDFRFPHF